MGFRASIEKWFRKELHGEVDAARLGGRFAASGHFERRFLAWVAREHTRSRCNLSRPIFSLAMFDTALRRVIEDRDAVREQPPRQVEVGP